jgi:hypothetical protein
LEWLLEIAKEYGFSVTLVVYVLWSNREREMKYISVIQTLSEDVKERLTKIEVRLWGDKN